MKEDCNTCHHSRWYRYDPNLGKCVAPLPMTVDDDGSIRGINASRPFTGCPAYLPRIPWLSKKLIDIGE